MEARVYAGARARRPRRASRPGRRRVEATRTPTEGGGVAEQGTENPGAAILLSRQKERGAQRTAVWTPQTRDEREPGAVGSVQQALCGTPRTGGPQKRKVGLAGVERVITEWAQVFFWDEEHNGIGNTLNATRMGHCVLCEFHLS